MNRKNAKILSLRATPKRKRGRPAVASRLVECKVYFDPHDAQYLKNAAEGAGMALSVYVRAMVLADLRAMRLRGRGA